MDAVDAALCVFREGRWDSLRETHTQPYHPDLRKHLLAVQDNPRSALSLPEWMQLDEAVARCFADAALALMKKGGVRPEDIEVIGAHGQTVFHDPRGIGSSLQLGNPSRIAAATGVPTVADFRRADIALGGEGAPLVPAFHHALFASSEVRGVLNLGGIANLTVLPGIDAAAVSGFDTGPGNALMDDWCATHTQKPYDDRGLWAATGAILPDLLEALLADSYFTEPPPKSTGRDRFNLRWARQRCPRLGDLSPANVQRTFCALTAESVARAVSEQRLTPSLLLVCGGGTGNLTLMRDLRERLAPAVVKTTNEYGLDARWVEAAAFAWLAIQRIHNLPGNLPSVTGAKRAACLGGVYSP